MVNGYGAFSLRDHVVDLKCITHSELCTLDSVFWLDRALFVSEDESAHLLSFKTQNGSAIFSAAVLLISSLGFLIAGGWGWIAWLTRVLNDWLLVALAVVLNGSINEIAKLISQRPRPHMYKHPWVAGDNPSHYTSFYSGHTSFVAACVMATTLILWSRKVDRKWVALVGCIGFCLVVWTGYLRVIAGRHFFTDVLVGGVVGALCARWVVDKHRVSDFKTPLE